MVFNVRLCMFIVHSSKKLVLLLKFCAIPKNARCMTSMVWKDLRAKVEVADTLPTISSPCFSVVAVDGVHEALRKARILYTALRLHSKICITARLFALPYLGTNLAPIAKAEEERKALRRPARTATAEVCASRCARLALVWSSRSSLPARPARGRASA
jgi:hypothetical protein